MNEVLRRKLFNKVMNANQPAGILASSPEMVETVQRRANGGSIATNTSPRRVIAGQQMMRQTAGLPTQIPVVDSGPNIFQRLFDARALKDARMFQGPPASGMNSTPLNVQQLARRGITSLGKQFSNAGDQIAADFNQIVDRGKAKAYQQELMRAQVLPAPFEKSAEGLPSGFPVVEDNTDAEINASETLIDSALSSDDAVVDIADSPMVGYDASRDVDDELENMGSVTAVTAPVIAAAEKEVAESSKPQATASNISTTFDKLTANLNSILGGGSATEKINPQQAEKTSTHAAFAAKLAEGPTAVEEVDLDKIEELVSETTGYDPEKSGEAKKGAFWNAVITAGLSIAAGESGNNLTNIAKGLGFAFNQYGKAVGELTAQDRADQKEARILRLGLIKDEKTANIAKAAKQDQYNQQVFQNDLALKQDGDIVAHRQRQNDINVAQIYANAEIKMLEAVNTKAYRDGDLDIKQQTLDEARDKALRDAQPDHVQSLLAVGHAKMVDGTPKLLPEYEKVYGPSFIPEIIKLSALAGSKGSNKLTDTDDLTAAYNQQYSFLSAAQARILAEQTKSGNLENFGSVNNAIQELFGIPIEKQQSGGGQQFTVGQIVNQAGSKFRITGFNQDGSPITEEIK